MEFLGITFQVSKELLWLPGLEIILFLFVNNVFEIVVADRAVPLASISVNALIMEGMAAHEMDCWQSQCLLTDRALFLVEIFSLSL